MMVPETQAKRARDTGFRCDERGVCAL